MSSIDRRDIYKRKQLGDKLLAILKISQKINAERDLTSLLNLIAEEATKLMEADRASIFLLDREKFELWSIVTLDSEPIRFDARLGLAGAAALTGQTINVEEAYQDSRFYKEIDECTGYCTRSLLAVPLRKNEGEIIGTFQILNKKSGAFNKDDEEILEVLAEQVAIAIETAHVVEELKRHRGQLLEENSQLWKEVKGKFSAQNIIGTSTLIQNVVRLIEQISDSSVDVLITGESGTGKELAAKAIHYNSSRSHSPFVALNSAALPENLVESELFGIEKGVATGVEGRIGKFEAANGGTLFLDEIGDLSLLAQAKILRVLQERLIERVGGRKAVPVDVRIIAATNKDLEEEIKKGNLREDLYYRLKVIHIEMPPLREIPEDIPILANHLLDKYCREMKKDPKKLSAGAVRCLMNYPWPGNVRQLENELKRIVVLTPREAITEEDLPETMKKISTEMVDSKLRPVRSLKETVEEVERRMIEEALQTCKQNQLQAAKALGLSRSGLIKKMKRYEIKFKLRPSN
ncbi:MAG: sigma 54-interacting transcriptional regulator [Deltaproteobacteria bacterium]|nr:sigma 54-interacting transcriptional regulator [Deltaproteobacteria bacterium]